MSDYVIVTAVKDEEQYIELTIESVVNQSIKPIQWIIIDDGSKDRTREIIDRYSRQHSWIKGIYGADQGPRKPGVRHIKAFYEGYDQLDISTWDFIVKLDGDLSFEENYFERCFEYFAKNKKLGIGGGIILNVTTEGLLAEDHPLFHVRGATKIYRRECWDAIGGIVISPCYDTLDEVKANMLGFESKSFENLKVLHHRYTGKTNGKWGNSVKNGLGDYISGYHPLFMIAKCARRYLKKPFSIDCVGLLYGFISGYLRNIPQAPDKILIRYLRQQQINRLTFRESIWR